MVVGFHLHMRLLPITAQVVNLITAHGEEYSIQSYVLKFVSDLQQVDGFLQLYTGFIQQQNLPVRYFIALGFFFFYKRTLQ